MSWAQLSERLGYFNSTPNDKREELQQYLY